VPFAEIAVQEWTESERDQILTRHDIKVSDLHHAVAKSLRNPRLLGIALELISRAHISNLTELSVYYLLFEHIRTSERDSPDPQPADQFSRVLQKHAQEIMSRLQTNQHDDVDVFEDELSAVADGRFFRAIDGDPMRYSLKDDGLTLALGFAIIDRLRIAKRNGRDVGSELDAILEPIAPLDDIANVILSALTVTIINNYEQDFAISLVKGFAELQNPTQANFSALVGLAKKRPLGFMDAAYDLSLAGGRQPNYDWIKAVLIEAGKNSHPWQEMAEKIHLWLSVYSLSPDKLTFAHPGNSQEKVQEEREKNRERIEKKLHDLSPNEKVILNNLMEAEGDLNELSQLSLVLLAGKPLAPFAKSFLNWWFAVMLNSDHQEPYKEFWQLVQLNRVDWSLTRNALLEMSAPLRDEQVSVTGKWTLVNILRSTGHSDDAQEALTLVESLTRDRPSFESWSLLEEYCATDPCDPKSQQPVNINKTSERYAAIDVSKLRQGRFQTSGDHFFAQARPGMVRFKPEIAIKTHKEFAKDIVKRNDTSLLLGLLELRRHNALLSDSYARELINKRNDVKTIDTTTKLSNRETWFISQNLLLLAFPFLSADEQVEILLSNDDEEKTLLDLMNVTKALDEKEFERLLGKACQEENDYTQYLLLQLARYTPVQFTAGTRAHLATLFRSKSDRVRAIAFAVISDSSDKELLTQVAQSAWNAQDDETEKSDEAWFGSVALIKAAARGLLDHNEAIDRISERVYGWAARMLDGGAVQEIARRIDVSINRAVGLEDDLIAPDIELQVQPNTTYEPSLFRLSEKPAENNDFREALKRFSESNEAFEQRQRKIYDAFLNFKAHLTHAKARIILDNIGLNEFAAIVEKAEDFSDRWHKLFMSIAEPKLPYVHNFIIMLAHALVNRAPGKAEELFRRVKDSKPLVRLTVGEASIQFDAIASWAGIRSPVIEKLCFARLDRAANDHEISMEVLAALLNGQQELLTAYIEAKLSSEEPAEISRGIMVAGFSNQSEFNDEILKRYEGSAGLVGSAQKAARYAYEHNVWARHWFEQMCQTDENTDFWRYSVLFLKIVDGRFDVWNENFERKGSSIQAFGPSVNSLLKNRFGKWENQRKKKLFGADAPAPIFLGGEDIND
jgi:hypothetical protein